MWARQGQLRQAGRDGYRELDAAELAVFHRLVTELDYDRARDAWRGARPALRDSIWATPLLVVLNVGRAEGTLVSSEEALFEFAGRSGRFQVIEVSRDLAEAVTGFRNATSARGAAEEDKNATKVRQLRNKGAK